MRSYGPLCDETCQNETQTSLLSYRDLPENKILLVASLDILTFIKANNKGTDQSAQMGRLVFAFVFKTIELEIAIQQYGMIS